MDYTQLTLGELLNSDDVTLKQSAKRILKVLKECDHKIEEGHCIYCLYQDEPSRQEYFMIKTVARDDLEGLGYDTRNVDDCDMMELAAKMEDAYCDNAFRIDLPIFADALDIPKHASTS